MVDDLEATVREVRGFAEGVTDLSEQTATSTDEIARVGEDISDSVQAIADGADRQHENVDEVTDEMTGLSATVEEIAASADELATLSARAVERGTEANELATAAVDEMDDVESSTERTAVEIGRLEAEMGEVGEVAELIDDIAAQTNLLALNASIEAARAGEAGDGFAVVANEIKALAEQTATATGEIETLVDGLQATTTDAAEDMRETRERVAEGIDTVEAALGALDDVVDHLEDADTGARSIDDATDEQAAASQQVVVMAEEVADISEATADESSTVAAAAEEQAASLSEVSDGIDTLSRRASDLRELLSRFEVSGVAGGTDGTGGRPHARDGLHTDGGHGDDAADGFVFGRE
jgi:methyl-accepting chemotaxis protein